MNRVSFSKMDFHSNVFRKDNVSYYLYLFKVVENFFRQADKGLAFFCFIFVTVKRKRGEEG